MRETVTPDTFQRVCPICGRQYAEAPALSRKDGTTYICPDCGTREALASAGIKNEQAQNDLLAIAHNTRFMRSIERRTE